MKYSRTDAYYQLLTSKAPVDRAYVYRLNWPVFSIATHVMWGLREQDARACYESCGEELQ